MLIAGVPVDGPALSRTLTVLVPLSVTIATSGGPSPLKSPAARAIGFAPAAYSTGAPKVASPLPRSRSTVLLCSSVTAISSLPSPSKSLTVTA